ncbi:hypothetical protein RJ639_004317 [Escallonia herrerae]|uniref:Transposase (putative) gypsy type domain-containing protein n=1 Tax=Escallonia herrerae TaxID=1293975 RepID=A0AA89AXD0_9ASTE|nr:hypothetical protein RJ639_004317 [Escallonia herrerae]
MFGWDSAQAEFWSSTVTLLGQSVRTGFCSGRFLFGHGHPARAKCSDEILLGQNSVRPRSLCSSRVFGRDFAWAEFCSATFTLFGQSVRTEFYSGKILFDHSHSARAECLDGILLGQSLSSFHVTSSFCSFLGLENMSESSTSISSSEENIYISSSSSSSKRVPTSGSEVGTLNPQLPPPSISQPLQPSSPPQPSTSQPPHSLSRKNALGDVKDQAEDKANPKPWYTADEESKPANYGTKFETGIYEEKVKSRYRLPLHPFALRFFEHYHMAPGKLVPNGWRKLVRLIYLVQTSGYKPNATDFMRIFLKICFVKGVANCPRWYYIHSRQRLLNGGPKSNKGWHSRYFFVGRLNKGKLSFDRDWNPYCKDFENPGKPIPNNLTKHILSHIKLRGGLSIDEPLSEEQLEWAKIIPPKPIPAGLSIPLSPPAIPSVSSAKTVPLGVLYGSIRDFLDGNVGDEWLKKRIEDGLEIYELGFTKAKEMFAERFPDIPLDDFVLPAVVSPSREIAMPSEAGDATASHLPGKGPSGDAPMP